MDTPSAFADGLSGYSTVLAQFFDKNGVVRYPALAMIKCKCDRCGVIHDRFPSALDRSRRYCSRACQMADRGGPGNPNYRAVPDVPCARCGTLVKLYGKIRKAQKAVCCSVACAAEARRLAPRPPIPWRPSWFAAMYAGEHVNTKPPPRGWESTVRPVPGLDGYFVTRDGIVVNHKGRVLTRTKHSDPDGYWRVSVMVDGHQRRARVHSMVACTWIGPRPSSRHLVAHWDGDRLNSDVDNLRWATAEDNWADMRRHGTAMIGSSHPRSKLTEIQVAEIRQRLLEGERVGRVAKLFGIGTTTIGHIKSRRSWKHIP
jgi:hypothetical protein